MGLKAVALAFLLDCKSTVTALHHQTLTTNPRLQSAADRKKKTREKYPSFEKCKNHFDSCFLSIITHCETCISKLSRCCTDETPLGFHVSRLDGVLKFARGILKHLRGGLKETEQIKHKTNFRLNLKVTFN